MITGIQYLRAIAALLVVWHHARIQLADLHPIFSLGFGERGVDLFFVISGFIMVATTQGKTVGAGEFIERRLWRVVPLYWIATTLVTISALVAPHLFKSTSPELGHVVQSLLFVPHASPSHPGENWPILVPGWTLNYEMFFYAVFAVCLAVAPGRRTVPALSAALGALVLVGWLFAPAQPVLVTWTNTLLVEFLLGAWLGRIWIDGKVVPLSPPWVVAGLIAGAVCLFSDPPVPRGVVQGIGAALIVYVTLAAHRAGARAWQWLSYLGDASYSIYLTHILSLGVLRVVWKGVVGTGGGLAQSTAFMLVALVFAALAGVLSYRFVEVPLLALSRRRRLGRPLSVAGRPSKS